MYRDHRYFYAGKRARRNMVRDRKSMFSLATKRGAYSERSSNRTQVEERSTLDEQLRG